MPSPPCNGCAMFGVESGSRGVCRGDAEQNTADQIASEQPLNLEVGEGTWRQSHHSTSVHRQPGPTAPGLKGYVTICQAQIR